MKGCNLSFYTLKPIKASFICNHYHHLIYYSYFIIKNDSQIQLVTDQPDMVAPHLEVCTLLEQHCYYSLLLFSTVVITLFPVHWHLLFNSLTSLLLFMLCTLQLVNNVKDQL